MNSNRLAPTLFFLAVCAFPVPAGAWVTEVVAWPEACPDGKGGSHTSIAVDASGAIHVSSLNEDTYALQYSTNASGVWVTEIVDWDSHVRFTSIALDGSGNPHISYYDRTNRNLKYATNSSGPWVSTTVDSDGMVGEYSSIALDGSGKAHISYYDLGNTHLKYATHSSGPWGNTTVDSDGMVGEYSSIALDGSGKAHISYLDRDHYTYRRLRYATNAGGPWVIEVVDEGGDYPSIALDAAGNAHMGYYVSMDDTLRYATNVAGAWVTEIASDRWPGSGGYRPSIAVSSSGAVHIIHHGLDGTLLHTFPQPCAHPADCDDGNPCTDANCVEGRCVYTYNADPCDDGDPCTMNNICSAGVCTGEPLDADGDGYVSDACGEDDCDDSDPSVHPGAPEICDDGVDNNCRGLIDCDDPECFGNPACVPEPCFIATAAFGSGQKPNIEVLRAFRDRYLSNHPAGRNFVRAYDAYGRPAAVLVAERPRLRALVRTLLFPVIGLASLLV